MLALVEKPSAPFIGTIAVLDIAPRTETTKLTIPESLIFAQVLACLPLFRNHAIAQECLDNRTVTDLAQSCYPLSLPWLSAIRGASLGLVLDENVQLSLDSIAKGIENLR